MTTDERIRQLERALRATPDDLLLRELLTGEYLRAKTGMCWLWVHVPRSQLTISGANGVTFSAFQNVSAHTPTAGAVHVGVDGYRTGGDMYLGPAPDPLPPVPTRNAWILACLPDEILKKPPAGDGESHVSIFLLETGQTVRVELNADTVTLVSAPPAPRKEKLYDTADVKDDQSRCRGCGAPATRPGEPIDPVGLHVDQLVNGLCGVCRRHAIAEILSDA